MFVPVSFSRDIPSQVSQFALHHVINLAIRGERSACLNHASPIQAGGSHAPRLRDPRPEVKARSGSFCAVVDDDRTGASTMRYLLPLLAFLAIPACGPPALDQGQEAPGQPPINRRNRSRLPTPEPAPVIANPTPLPRPVTIDPSKARLAGFRMVRDGAVYLLREHRKEGKNYVVRDVYGKVTSHLIASVTSIEPLTGAQLDEAMVGYETPGTRNKDKPKAKPPTVFVTPEMIREFSIQPPPPPVARSSSDQGSSGQTLHTGPRGGVYHISKNGNKVYHPR